MLFNLTFDQSDANLPAGFKAVVNAVAQFFQSHFSAPITINIDVGYGEINNQPLGSGALGESETFLNNYSYAQVRNGLATHAPSADATTALNSLPAGDPIGSAHAYWLATAEAKALGLQGASSSTDGFVGFGNNFPFFYDATHTQAVPAGQYDFFAVVAHEFSEVMGRMLFTGSNIGGTNAYDLLDLFHYSGQNTRDFSGTTPGYFSINGGTTNLDNFNTNPGGDFGDWASSAGHDSFLAFSPSGVLNAISEADLKLLDALGYERGGGPTGTPSPGAIAFTGDFNGDLKSDILWQDSSTGLPTMWLMNGTSIVSSTALTNQGASWHLVGTGDFNGDHMSDALWRNDNGTVEVWEMNGTQVLASGLAYPTAIPASWHIVGTGDFNADGKSDILWRADDGTVGVWLMNGTQEQSFGVTSSISTSWHVAGTGDFNGDGKSDIVWRADDGSVGVWLMNGVQAQSFGLSLPGPVPNNWHIVGTGDFANDGKSDLLWVADDGSVGIWEMNGIQYVTSQVVGFQTSGWHVIGTGDFNADGHSDILWRNDNGTVQVWEMNGFSILSQQTLSGAGGSAIADSSTEGNGGTASVFSSFDAPQNSKIGLDGSWVHSVFGAEVGSGGPSAGDVQHLSGDAAGFLGGLSAGSGPTNSVLHTNDGLNVGATGTQAQTSAPISEWGPAHGSMDWFKTALEQSHQFFGDGSGAQSAPANAGFSPGTSMPTDGHSVFGAPSGQGPQPFGAGMPTDGHSAAGPVAPSGQVAHVFGSDPGETPVAQPQDVTHHFLLV